MTSPHQPGTEWDTPSRQKMLVFRNDCNLSCSEIQSRIGVPRTTICHIIISSVHEIIPRSGWPRKLTGRDVRRLVRAVTSSKDGRKASYLRLAKELGIQASEATIWQVLRKTGFRRCGPYPKSLISWINRRKRLKRVREHLHWEIEGWMRVIFSDESTFETGKSAWELVTRTPWEKYCPDCINNYKHSGRKSVMVLGANCGTQGTHFDGGSGWMMHEDVALHN